MNNFSGGRFTELIWQKYLVTAHQNKYISYVHVLLADSTVLAFVMKTLNERYNYGLDLILLSVDEGITGYRDDSLEVLLDIRGLGPVLLNVQHKKTNKMQAILWCFQMH